MKPVRSLAFLLAALAMGCGESNSPVAPEASPSLAASRGGHHNNRVEIKMRGRADHTRTVGTVTAMTLFRFELEQKANGNTRGHYYYNFQAAGFAVRGPVTCVTVTGNQAWVGGTVESIDSPDPEDQSLVGLDMWWRSVDNDGLAPDSTTGLGFAFPGSTITAESWCNDQPVALVMRQVEKGNVRIKTH